MGKAASSAGLSPTAPEVRASEHQTRVTHPFSRDQNQLSCQFLPRGAATIETALHSAAARHIHTRALSPVKWTDAHMQFGLLITPDQVS